MNFIDLAGNSLDWGKPKIRAHFHCLSSLGLSSDNLLADCPDHSDPLSFHLAPAVAFQNHRAQHRPRF